MSMIGRSHKIVICALLFIVCGCGGGGPSVSGNSSAKLSITVHGAKNLGAETEAGRVTLWRVAVGGEGIEPEVVQEFAGDAVEGVVENVPVGDDRTVSVAGVNLSGSRVYEGETAGVSIDDGRNDVNVELESVPVFANLKKGSRVDSKRLSVKLYSADAHAMTVEYAQSGQNVQLADADTSAFEILPDTSTGIGLMKPALIPAGAHEFIARDLVNQKTAAVLVNVIDGEKIKPAPLFAAQWLDKKTRAAVSHTRH